MIHRASPGDRFDPDAYVNRRKMWEKRFKQSGAMEVHQFPLLSFTQSDLRSCIGKSK